MHPLFRFKVEAVEITGTGTSGRLLVTYDDSNGNFRKFFQRIIESKGFTVACHCNGSDGGFLYVCPTVPGMDKKGRAP